MSSIDQPVGLTLSGLPNPALLHIFQLICDSWSPETPGTCYLAPVCKRWRGLTSQVKGLRVVFQGYQQQQVASFRAWLRRHAPQIKALAINTDKAVQILRALAAAATIAAAASKLLPLQRLVVTRGQLWDSEVCEDVLLPLLATLPHLQHLHLPLAAPVRSHHPEAAGEAAAGALAQASTTLTSLVLDGPRCQAAVADAAHTQLLSSLPTTLHTLTWRWQTLRHPRGLSFRHLTGLTHLRLVNEGPDMLDFFAVDAFDGLQHLRKLDLYVDDGCILNEGLLAVKKQLVGLALAEPTEVLGQLTHLQSLRLTSSDDGEQLLQQAPQLQQLQLQLGGDRGVDVQAWSRPWLLQHYSNASSLQRLILEVFYPQAAPLELCALRQLRQLSLTLHGVSRLGASDVLSWACVLAGLVNLEVLTIPAVLTACHHPWLAGFQQLVVLEVLSDGVATDIASAAAHISRLLAPGSSSLSSSSSGSGKQKQAEQVLVVCLDGSRDPQQAVLLYKAVAAAVPVLPPNQHLFRGSWQLLQECGLELWPAPVAARLQQLLLC